MQDAPGLIITVVTDLPQIEWGLKTESLTAVYQFAPAFVELRCLAALFFCQRPDDAVQRTAAAQFLRRSVARHQAPLMACRRISAPCGRPPASVARSAPARWPLPVQARRSPAAGGFYAARMGRSGRAGRRRVPPLPDDGCRLSLSSPHDSHLRRQAVCGVQSSARQRGGSADDKPHDNQKDHACGNHASHPVHLL